MVIKSGLHVSTRPINKPVARYNNPAPLSDRFDFLSTEVFLIGGGAKKKVRKHSTRVGAIEVHLIPILLTAKVNKRVILFYFNKNFLGS